MPSRRLKQSRIWLPAMPRTSKMRRVEMLSEWTANHDSLSILCKYSPASRLRSVNAVSHWRVASGRQRLKWHWRSGWRRRTNSVDIRSYINHIADDKLGERCWCWCRNSADDGLLRRVPDRPPTSMWTWQLLLLVCGHVNWRVKQLFSLPRRQKT